MTAHFVHPPPPTHAPQRISATAQRCRYMGEDGLSACMALQGRLIVVTHAPHEPLQREHCGLLTLRQQTEALEEDSKGGALVILRVGSKATNKYRSNQTIM